MECVTSPCPGHTTGAAGQLFTILLQSVMAAPCNLSNPNIWPEDLDKLDDLRYDFIVVGAGSAGSVVADRLSQNTGWKVLLIEAGGDPPISSEIPSELFTLQQTEIDWGYYTEQSPNYCLGYKTQRCPWPRGKVLGGTSTINAMLYIRGNREDYDKWEAQGNPGWGFDDVLPYFKKSEDMRVADVLAQDYGHYHSVGGDLKVDSYYNDVNVSNLLLQAAQELGYDFVLDINSDESIGYTLAQGTLDHGTRCSAAKAFLTHKQSNLHVLKNSHVTNVIIDPQTRSAVGVRFIKNSRLYIARASKEVVLSAGVINSPQILMLSGIGPREHLEKLQIKPIVDLPVGRNLQDHFYIPFWVSLNRETAEDIPQQLLIDIIYSYFMKHEGPFSGIADINVIGFINLSNLTSEYPNTEYLHYYSNKGDTLNLPVTLQKLGCTDETISDILQANQESDTLVVVANLLSPKSLGEVKLRSKDPLDKPLIYPNYLDSPEDMRAAKNTVRFTERFLSTEAMQKVQAEFININLPNCDNCYIESDYWECYIRNVGTTLYHPVGTVKMGPRRDRTSVVDHKLRVHGIQNLRVIDSSIMPIIPRGHMNAPSTMIGEKGADMMKNYWKCS